MAAELLKAGRVQTKSQNRRENAMTNAELNAMPSISSLMTTDELFEWPAAGKRAALAIDIESCELGQWKSCAADPYGVLEMSLEDFVAKGSSARRKAAAGSRRWICRATNTRR